MLRRCRCTPRRHPLAFVVVAALLAGCGRTPAGPGKPTVAAVLLSRDTATLFVGGTVQLSAQPLDAYRAPVSGAPVSWSSTDPARATVSGNGLVTGRAPGSVQVIAQAGARADTAAVAVLNPPALVRVTAPAESLRAGQVLQLSATVSDGSGVQLPVGVAWHSSDPRVLTITDWGLVASQGPAGSSAITAAVAEVTSPELKLRVVAGPPAALRAVAGALQAHPPGVAADELVAEVVDAWENPVPGQPVDWSVRSGGGALEAATTFTDAAGLARNRVIAGPGSGEELVLATTQAVADSAHFRIGVVAAHGYTTFGNAIFDSTGAVRVFHGVNRPSLEWRVDGDHVSAADFQLMHDAWKSDIVRIPLNQDFWLEGAAQYDAGYRATVDQAVRWALAAGLHVILDLHWSDKGKLRGAPGAQQRMPDANSVVFWQQVAQKYKDETHVLFDLYNEPHDVSWDVWQHGGAVPDYTPPGGKTDSAFSAAGMQQLYDAVRGSGAENLVLVGGLDWGYDLSGVPQHRIAGHNIIYSTHPYEWKAEWQARAFFLAATDPVFMGEFGAANCATKPYDDAIALADRTRVSWTAWAWWSGQPSQICGFPTVLADWNGTPSVMGAVVKAALARYLPSGLLPPASTAARRPAQATSPAASPASAAPPAPPAPRTSSGRAPLSTPAPSGGSGPR